jgi:hypothetical protein
MSDTLKADNAADSGLRLTACSVLLDLAIRWLTQAEIHEAEGEKDCGTGSDVPYAMASMLREHAAEIERLAYVFSPQNAPNPPTPKTP